MAPSWIIQGIGNPDVPPPEAAKDIYLILVDPRHVALGHDGGIARGGEISPSPCGEVQNEDFIYQTSNRISSSFIFGDCGRHQINLIPNELSSARIEQYSFLHTLDIFGHKYYSSGLDTTPPAVAQDLDMTWEARALLLRPPSKYQHAILPCKGEMVPAAKKTIIAHVTHLQDKEEY